MSDNTDKKDVLTEPRIRLLPFYCEGSAEGFFKGWHPYVVPESATSVDGLPNWRCYWIAKWELLNRLARILRDAGIYTLEGDPYRTNSYQFARWLGENYPGGLVFEQEGYQRPVRVVLS